MLGDSQQQPVTGSGESPSLSDARKGALGCATVLLGLAVVELLGMLVWAV